MRWLVFTSMKFKNYILDPFQKESIQCIENHHSVVVSAATGTGKTLVADYVIDKYLKTHRKIIYTAPIKALSNQKFKDFRATYGEQAIGILTGDIVINPNAQVLIMTTEIFRNMLMAHDPLVDDVEYVVFDEIHYMNDPERGTVWEEAILLSPKHLRFLCLSATIPNAKEFAGWMSEVKDHTVDVIRYKKRAVPLKHLTFDSRFGLVSPDDLVEKLKEYRVAENRINRKKKGKKKKPRIQPGSPNDVVCLMEDNLPAIVFSFSRKACVNEAVELGANHDFLCSDEERFEIKEMCNRFFSDEIFRIETTQVLCGVLEQGIAFHHAGLLPQHKTVVEELFSRGLIRVLFATETFSVGINMPAKTVVFNGFRKYDGKTFRVLNSKEYFQLAGRAGRRGIDTVGYVVSIFDERDISAEELAKISKADTEPIRSQFQLSYNTVLNLLAEHTSEEIDDILRNNFDVYLRKKSSKRQLRIKTSFANLRRTLERMGYLDDRGILTNKGMFARYIYSNELLLTELCTTPRLYESLTNTELLQVIAAIMYEPRQTDHFSFRGINSQYKVLLTKLRKNGYVARDLNKLSLKRMMGIVGLWSDGAEFEELMEMTKLSEGDIIRLFRRLIDVLMQIRRATLDDEFSARIDECKACIDRDLVSVSI